MPEVMPTEDLMQEHGVLQRLLLIYQEVLRQIDSGENPNLKILTGAAGIIRSFIEDYHEKLEEEFVFPRFREANTLVDLVKVLYLQHERGRSLTEKNVKSATGKNLKTADGRGVKIRVEQDFQNPRSISERRQAACGAFEACNQRPPAGSCLLPLVFPSFQSCSS